MPEILLPLYYCAPLSWYSVLIKNEEVLIEKQEHYRKQSYRNRCSIYGPNGKLNLIIPVKKIHGEHTLYRDIQIDNEERWQRIHWLSLQSAYRNSPFFEFYEDEFKPFFHKEFKLLFDLNLQLNDKILSLLKINKNLKYNDSYNKDVLHRFDIHAKKESDIQYNPYYQVFKDKFGFMSNLSILDLLFNTGPAALSVLANNVIKPEI